MFLFACVGPDPKESTDTHEGPDTAETSSESGDTPHSDSDTAVSPAVTGVTATVDDDIGALVWVSWEQAVAADAHVEFRFEGDAWLSAPSRALTPGPQQQLVAGAPYGATIEARVVTTGAHEEVSEVVSITSDPIPEDIPVAFDVSGDPGAWDPGTPYVLLSLSGSFGSWNLIVDRLGRVVWALEPTESRVSIHTRVSWDGHDLLIDQNSFWGAFDEGKNAEVHRMKLDGTLIEEMGVPGAHHPFTDMPDGSLLFASRAFGFGERLVRRWPDGKLEVVWNCEQFAVTLGATDGCGSNTLWYDAENDTVYDSLYSLETIVEVGVSTAVPVRWFGHLQDAWAFDPPESAFWWQHGVNLTAAGTLLTSSMGVDRSEELVVREYAFDPGTQTLTEVWSFGDGEGVFGDVMGEAHRLGNGNTLHNYGNAIRLREATPDGRVVWDVSWEASTMGRSTPVADLYAFVE